MLKNNCICIFKVSMRTFLMECHLRNTNGLVRFSNRQISLSMAKCPCPTVQTMSPTKYQVCIQYLGSMYIHFQKPYMYGVVILSRYIPSTHKYPTCKRVPLIKCSKANRFRYNQLWGRKWKWQSRENGWTRYICLAWFICNTKISKL